jgi:hypothetical protein
LDETVEREEIDPTESFIRQSEKAQEIARDVRHRLRESSGDLSSTNPVNVNVFQPEKPQTAIELGPVKIHGVPKWLGAIVVVLITAATALASKIFRR